MVALSKVAAKEVRVVSLELERLVPNECVCTEMRLPVELDEGTQSVAVDEDESVDAESLHHTVRARDGVDRKSVV